MYRWSLNGQQIHQNQIERKKDNKTDTRKTNNMSISNSLVTRELQINNNNNNNNNNNKKNKNKKKMMKNKNKNKKTYFGLNCP